MFSGRLATIDILIVSAYLVAMMALGLALAGFLAALMSSLDSNLSSSATLVTMDFVRLRWPHLSGRALLRIGRVSSVVLLLFAIMWAPQIARFDSLFKYFQMIMSYAAGPVVLLFLAGIFWPRANRAGAMAAVVTGLAAAAIIFVAREVTGSIDWHFLLVGPAVFVASALAMVAASLATPPPALSRSFWRSSSPSAERHWLQPWRPTSSGRRDGGRGRD